MEKAKIIKVIKSESKVGTGTENDPVRNIIQYWEQNGKLIATIDPYEEIKNRRRIDIEKVENRTIEVNNFKFEPAEIKATDDSIILEVGKSKIEITKDIVKIKSADIQLIQNQ